MIGATGARATRFVSAIVLLVTCGVGVPWGLLAAARARFGGGSPLAGAPPPSAWRWTAIRRALTSRLTEDTVADLVIRTALVVAWVAVVAFLLTVVAEVAHMARHGGLPMPQVRGLGWSQSVARVVAAGLLVVAPMLTSPSRASARDGFTLHPPTPSGEPVPTVVVDDWSRRPIAPPDTPSAPTPSAPPTYVVRPGDSVFGIAARIAGPEPSAVHVFAEEVLELNLGRTMPDGRRFDNAAYLQVGWVLELPAGTSSTPAPAAVEPDQPDEHVVERGETLWSIADDELGAAERWPEIFELNHGRTFDDGRELRDPDVIQPGWDLDLPDAPPVVDTRAAPPPPVDPPVPDPVTSEATDAPDDTPLDTTTPDHTPSNDTSPDHTPPPDDTPLDTTTPDHTTPDHTTPDHTPPDQTAPDDTPDDARSDEAPAAAPNVGAARPSNRWVDLVPIPAPPAPTSDPDAPEVPAPGSIGTSAGPLLTPVRAAMLSAGVLTVVAVRRRDRLRRSRPRARLRNPTDDVVRAERQLRSGEPGDRLLRVDVAIRAAARSLVAADARVVAVIVGDDGALDLHVSSAVLPDAQWELATSARCWRLPSTVTVEQLAASARGVGWPCPTLVQLGRTVDDRDLYVDLEALEAVEVGGPGDQADAIVRAIAVTRAGSVFAEVATLVAAGVDDAAFLGHRGHVPARDGVEAFERAAAALGSTATAARSTFELRARATGGETWEPAVVLVGAAVGTITPPPDRTGLAVVSAAPIHGPSTRLAPDGDAWLLLPLGIRCVPVGVTRPELGTLAALVASTDDDDLTLAPVPDELPVEAAVVVEPAPRPPVMVCLLGPVAVRAADGGAATFEKSKAKELVVWLATHRERATRSGARTAMWELDVRDATFANVVSEARRSLARLAPPPAGEEWIGRTLTESLPLHELVRTDADVVREALELARRQPPHQAIATLRPAVELVVGVPFEGTDYLWPDAEGITSQLVLLATSVTTELAERCLAVGDVDGVFDATGRGLQVLPGHEGLIALRMRAHARAGDHAGVRHEWEQYERVITADPWSDGEPAPELVDLRRRLLAR